MSRRLPAGTLFVLLGLFFCLLGVGLRLLLLRNGWELGLIYLLSFRLVELLGFLVELVQVKLSDDVLLKRNKISVLVVRS